jgi:NAD(P)-dependent dehydrogenase (short-subunit alcohol dehydrogenase family)
MPAYVASKHALVGLTRNAALDYASKNIRINSVCPGVIETPMIERFTHGSKEAYNGLKGQEPIGRLGRPEEIADAVLWLSRPGAAFVNGAEIAVDGGWCAK